MTSSGQHTAATISSYTFPGLGEGHTQRTPTVLCPPSMSVVQNHSLPQELEKQPHPFSRRKRLSTKAWASERKQSNVVSHHITVIWIEPHCWLNLVQTPWVDIPPFCLNSLCSHVHIHTTAKQETLFSNGPCLNLNCFSHPIQTNLFLPTEIFKEMPLFLEDFLDFSVSWLSVSPSSL